MRIHQLKSSNVDRYYLYYKNNTNYFKVSRLNAIANCKKLLDSTAKKAIHKDTKKHNRHYKNDKISLKNVWD